MVEIVVSSDSENDSDVIIDDNDDDDDAEVETINEIKSFAAPREYICDKRKKVRCELCNLSYSKENIMEHFCGEPEEEMI